MLKAPKVEDTIETNSVQPLEAKKPIIFVVLKEVDEQGKNRVIYASSVDESGAFVIVKHNKKDGTPCTSKFNPDLINKIYSEDK